MAKYRVIKDYVSHLMQSASDNSASITLPTGFYRSIYFSIKSSELRGNYVLGLTDGVKTYFYFSPEPPKHTNDYGALFVIKDVFIEPNMSFVVVSLEGVVQDYLYIFFYATMET